MAIKRILFSAFVTPLLLFYFAADLHAFQADSTAAGSIQLSSNIDRTETPLNQPVELTVTLSWEGRPNRYKVDPFENPNLTNFEITGSSTNSRSEVLEGKLHTVKDFSFVLYPVEMGMAYVDEIVITWSDSLNGVNDNLVTQRMSVKVVAPVYEADYSWIWQMFFAVAAVGVLAGGGIYFMRRRKQHAVSDEPPPRPLEDVVMEEITTFTSGVTGSYKKPLDELVSAFRKYLIDKFEVAEGSRSDSGIMSVLEKNGLDAAVIDKVRTVFDRAEQLRFSGADVQPDQYEFIRGLVESTVTACRNVGKSEQAGTKSD